jgi:hypothetical protein
MSIRLPLGADVILARNGFTVPGKLFLQGYTSIGVMADYRPGYAGWQYNATTIAACEALSAAVIKYLTGKTYGANLLLHMAESETDRSFGTYFRAWCAAHGHTITYTGGIDVGVVFGGETLHDYDALLLGQGAMYGILDETDALDEYLATQGAVWGGTVSTDPWTRYGFEETGRLTSVGGPNYLRYFECDKLGGGAFGELVVTTSNVHLGTNTMGGTATSYLNDAGDEAIGIWES